MAEKRRQSGIDMFVETNGETTACFHYDHATGTQAVVFFAPGISRGPLEYRIWNAQWPMDDEARLELLDEFDVYPKHELSVRTEGFRSVPWGQMIKAAKAFTGEEQLERLSLFKPPTEEVVQSLYDAGELMGFRNVRDLFAHASELRLLKPYLEALYIDKSSTAIEDAAAEEQIDSGRARNLIGRARTHGYLERSDDAPLGRLTDEALARARAFWETADRLERGQNR